MLYMIKIIGFIFLVKAKLFLNAEQHIPGLPKLGISIPDHNSHESRDKSEQFVSKSQAPTNHI